MWEHEHGVKLLSYQVHVTTTLSMGSNFQVTKLRSMSMGSNFQVTKLM